MEKESFTAKKSLGQNFLHAPHAVDAMVHSAYVMKGDKVLEVGPGKGALTIGLLSAGAMVKAVEKDDRAIPFLKEKFAKEIESGQLEIIHADIMEIDPGLMGLENGKYSIVANIPYYISGEFLRKFLESEIQPIRMVIMLQKELAKRIVDEKGSILSVSVRAYGNPKYITSVPRKFFRPMPNVDSAIISIENISKNFFKNPDTRERTFFAVVKAGFLHKRKILINNLKERFLKDRIASLWEREKWSENRRAEEFSLEDWKKVALAVELDQNPSFSTEEE